MNHGFIAGTVTKAAAGRKARSLTIRSHMASCSSVQLPCLYYTCVVSLEHPNKVSFCWCMLTVEVLGFAAVHKAKPLSSSAVR